MVYSGAMLCGGWYAVKNTLNCSGEIFGGAVRCPRPAIAPSYMIYLPKPSANEYIAMSSASFQAIREHYQIECLDFSLRSDIKLSKAIMSHPVSLLISRLPPSRLMIFKQK